MRITAHLSDPHIDGSQRSRDRLSAVADYLDSLIAPIDAVLVTGDVADNGEREEYQLARQILRPRWPVLWCPGNHDDREAFAAELLESDGGVGGPVNRVREIGGITYLLCDSTIPGRPEGVVEDSTLAWLDETLTARPDSPAYLCLHHPLMDLGYFVDDIRLRDEQRLAEVLARHPQLVAVLCGHAHTPAAATFAGLPVRVGGGIASTSRLPWESTERLDFDAPPAVSFHLLDERRRVVTHIRSVS